MSTVLIPKKDQTVSAEKYSNYASIANASHDFMSLINRNFEYEVVNEAYRRTLPPELREIEGRKVKDVWKHDGLERIVMPNLRRCFAGESIFYEAWFQFHQYGYGYFEVHFSPHFDDTGRVSHVAAVARDTTKRKIAEEESRRTREEWELTFHSVSDMILVISRDFRILRLNKAASSRLGLSPEEAVGSHCYQVVHGLSEPPPYCPQAELLANKQEFVVHVQDDHLNGFFVFNMVPFGTDGEIEASVHIIRDITGRRQAEEERERLIFDLQQAIKEVKILEGMIPICSSCKKIRDDEGYWQQLEKYIQEHTDARFSHSLCPDCVQRFYPDLMLDIINHRDPK